MPAQIPNRISTQIRIDATLHQKLRIIAIAENRNMNSQLEYFVKKGIESYERENGEVTVADE